METISTLEEYWKIPRERRRDKYLAESASLKIPVQDNGERIIGITIPKVHCAENNTYALREGVIERLRAATSFLPAGLHLKLYSTFRPVEVQRELFAKFGEQIQRQRPELQGQALHDEVTQFVADPNGCPPHTTGGAMDVTLCDEIGNDIHMGSAVNVIEPLGISHSDSALVDEVARKNRGLLYSTMSKAGFFNLPTEWWHFSYGDQYWAAFTEHPVAVYGPRPLSDFPGHYSR